MTTRASKRATAWAECTQWNQQL